MSEHTKGRLAYMHTLPSGTFGDTGWNVQFLRDAKEADSEMKIHGGTVTPLVEDPVQELAAARAQNERLTAMVQEQDRMLGQKACATKECRELLAARALLREVLVAEDESEEQKRLIGFGRRTDVPPDPDSIIERVRSYLDACDTLGGKL